jgi:quercetin dioxygenase-like cupin family protein
MRISHGRDGRPSRQRDNASKFSGGVWVDPVLDHQDDIWLNTNFFEPGAHTHWHSHAVGQIVHVTAGAGFIQSRDGTRVAVSAGDVVHIPAGEEHWHSAGPDSFLVQLSIAMGAVSWLGEVTEDDVRAAVASQDAVGV